MHTILKYFFIGQASLYGGIWLSLVLLPEAWGANDGVSYFGAHWPSVVPFTAGLLIMAACSWLIARHLPAEASGFFRGLVRLTAVLLAGVALVPFGVNEVVADVHVWLSKALFLVQFLTVVSIVVFVRRGLVSTGWLATSVASILAMVGYWAPRRGLLIVGELLCQVVFSVAAYTALSHYAGKSIPVEKPERVRAPLLATQKGFTIIELMIATTVFSLVLLMCSFGLIQIGRTYNKGITNARTQEAARSIMDEISRAIQFSGGTIATTPAGAADGTAYVFCIDEQRYSYVLDRQLKDSPENNRQTRNVLVADTYAGCNASTTPRALPNTQALNEPERNPREMIPANMRLARLEVNYLNNSLYQVTVRVVAGEDDLLDDAHDNCRNVRAGTQFCAVSELTTVVQKRL